MKKWRNFMCRANIETRNTILVPVNIFHKLCFLSRCTMSGCNLCEQTTQQNTGISNGRSKNHNRYRISGFITLTVPEQAQGASNCLELSNSSSWQILQREIPESDLRSSISNTTSSMFLTTIESSVFLLKTSALVFKFCLVLCFSLFTSL